MEDNKGLAFGKRNYILLFAGIIMIAVGLLIMTMETAQYGFGVLGLTIGPIIMVIGFITNFFAIFARDSNKKEEKKD